MRVLLKVSLPVEAGNKALQSGVLEQTVANFVKTAKPEAAYFSIENGFRTMYFFVDLLSPAEMPVMGEPFFTQLNALIWTTPVMNLEDLKAGIGKVFKKA